jgi:hypothetical protein
MSVLAALLRYFSYLFHLALSGFLLGVASLAVIGGTHTLQFEMLPWTGRSLTWWMFGLGLLGIVSVILAMLGKVRLLFPLWALLVVVLIVKGYFLSSYTFRSEEEFHFVIYLTIAADFAFLGSLTLLLKRRRR